MISFYLPSVLPILPSGLYALGLYELELASVLGPSGLLVLLLGFRPLGMACVLGLLV